MAAGAIAFGGIFVLNADAEYLFDGLTSRALPLVLRVGGVRPRLAGAAGAASATTAPGRSRSGAVASVVVAWGVAQWDYMLPESLTVADAAAPDGHPHGRARRRQRSPS